MRKSSARKKKTQGNKLISSFLASSMILPIVGSAGSFISASENTDNQVQNGASDNRRSEFSENRNNTSSVKPNTTRSVNKDYSKIATPDKPDNTPTYLNKVSPTQAKIGGGKQLKNSVRLDGGKLNLNIKGKNITFENGYMAHAPATIEFDVSELSKTNNLFSTYIGIDPKLNGNVKYKFYLDDKLVYTSRNLDKREGERVNLPLNSAKKLKVVIDDNGNVHQDHAVLADMKLVQINDLPEIPNYEAEKEELAKKTNLKNAEEKENKKDLYRLRFDRLSSNDIFSTLVEEPKYRALYDWIRDDYEALELLAQTNPPAGGYNNFFDVLNQIYSVDKSIKKDSLNKKLALATALEFSRPVSFWANKDRVAEPVGRYQIYRDLSRTPGELLSNLNTYDIEETRAIVSAEISNEDLLWIREKIKKEKKDFLKSPEKLSDITYQYLKYNLFNKYGDSVQTSNFYGVNPNLERIVEFGGVCGAISKFDVAVLRAFGIPANVIGQPGHAAVTFLGTNKVWKSYNFITGWDRSQGGVYSSFANTFEKLKTQFKYNNSTYTTTYNQLTQDAKRDPQAYKEANYYYLLALETSDENKKKVYLEKAISINLLFLPAHDELIFSELNKGDSLNEQALASYVNRAIEDLKKHPKPVMDIAYAVKDKFKSRAFKVDFYAKLNEVEELAQTKDDLMGDMAKQIARTKEFQELIKDGKTFLGSFSFDGEHAERLWGTKTDTEYSLDGGKTWKKIKVANQLLTQEEVKQINADNGILLRLARGEKSSAETSDSQETKGQEESGVLKIKIIQPDQPSLDMFSRERFITGLDESMEWSLDGKKWYPYDQISTYLENSNKIQVRHKRTGNKLESKARSFDFTNRAKLEDIMHLNTKVISTSSQEEGYDKKDANNGHYKNFVLSALNGSDSNPQITFEFDQEYTIKGFRYVPRQDGKSVGNIVRAKIEVSSDNSKWENAGEVHFTYRGKKDIQTWTATSGSEKKAKYLRITVLESGKDKPDDFATVLGMADIMFQTTAEEAQKGQTAYAERSSKENLDQLKKGIQTANETVEKLKKQVETLESDLTAKKSQSTYSEEKIKEIETALESLKEKIKKYEEQKEERSKVEENADNRSKLQDNFINSRNDSLSIAADARLVEARLLYLDAKDDISESLEESKKIEEEAKKVAEEFKERNKEILEKLTASTEDSGTSQNLSAEDKEKLEEVYYEMNSLPIRAKENLKEIGESLKKIVESSNKEKAKEAVKSFKEDYAELIALKPKDLTKTNYKKYKKMLAEAKERFDALDKTERKSIEDEVWHLFYPTFVSPGKRQEPMGTYIEKLESGEANQELRKKFNAVNAYRRSMPTVTDKQEELKERLKKALLEVKKVAENYSLSTGDYYKAGYNLDVAFNEIKLDIQKENDRIERVALFRTQHKDLLNKDLLTVNNNDKKKAEAAIKVFNRLTDAAKNSLKAEKQFLDSIIAVATVAEKNRAENITFLKEKLKSVMASKDVVAEELPINFATKLDKLFNVTTPTTDDASQYKTLIEKLENGIKQLESEASDYQAKLVEYRANNADVLKKKLADFGLNDEASLKKAEEDLKALESSLGVSIPALRNDLAAKQSKLTELKARAYEIEKSEEDHKKALAKEEAEKAQAEKEKLEKEQETKENSSENNEIKEESQDQDSANKDTSNQETNDQEAENDTDEESKDAKDTPLNDESSKVDETQDQQGEQNSEASKDDDNSQELDQAENKESEEQAEHEDNKQPNSETDTNLEDDHSAEHVEDEETKKNEDAESTIVDESPVVDDSSTTDDVSTTDDAPITDEDSTTDEAPTVDEAPVEEKTPLVDETLVVDETTSNDTSDDEITPDLEEESSSETQDSELVPEEETDNQENSELDEEKEVITDELSEDKTSVDETPIVDGDNNEVGENLTYEELADDLETTDFESENSNLLANEERFAVSKVSDLALNLNQNNSVRLASVKDATKEENKQWQITRNKPETKSEEKIEEQENTAVLLPPVNSISEDELETLSQDIQTVITSKESKPSPVIKKLEAVKTEVEKVSPWYKALAAFASLSVLGTCVGFGVKKLHKH